MNFKSVQIFLGFSLAEWAHCFQIPDSGIGLKHKNLHPRNIYYDRKIWTERTGRKICYESNYVIKSAHLETTETI